MSGKKMMNRAAIGIMAFACCSAIASAALINATGQNPTITFNGTGTTAFDPTTHLFVVHADPLQILWPDATVNNVDPAPVISKDVRIRVLVNAPGTATSNGLVDDFVVEGQIDTNGDTIPEYTGTLLTGKLVAFGYQNAGPANIPDKFDFIFDVTGGVLAPHWAGSQIYVSYVSEGSTFGGSFTVAFTGGAKGNIQKLPCQKQAISGVVKCDRDNTPVVGATITVIDSENNVVATTTTGADGSYSVPNLTAAVTYTVSVSDLPPNTKPCSPGTVTVPLPCTHGADAVNFCVCRCLPSAIKGKVACSPGRTPIQGAGIEVFNSANVSVGTATSAADGTYSVPNLSVGSYTVEVTPPAGYKLCDVETIPVTLLCEEDGVANFCVCVCEASRIVGKVTCDLTNPPNPPTGMANVGITVVDSAGETVGTATTASGGTYTVGNLPIGTYTVTATPPTGAKLCDGQGSVSVQLGCEQDGTADFCVCPCLPSNITGHVLCSRDNSPVQGAIILALDSSSNPAGSDITDDKGNYSISGLAIGTYSVSVVAPANYKLCGVETVTVKLVCEQDGTANFCVCPCLPSNITGTVTCPRDNSAISGVLVTATDGTHESSATTNDQGSYTISSLPPGSYTVTVTPDSMHKSCDPSPSQTVVLSCEHDGTANFCLCPCLQSKITGKVACPATGGIPNVTVNVYASDTSLAGSTTTQPDGTYTVTGLDPDTYSVEIAPVLNTQLCDPEGGKVSVKIECEKDGTADFCLCPCTRSSIKGKVVCALGAAMAGVTVTAYDGSNSVGSDVTDVYGSYSIDNLTQGTYTVKMTALDNTYVCDTLGDTQSVELACSQDGTADFCLCPCTPSNITGKVVCDRNNAGVANATITAYDSTNQVAGTATTAADGSYTIAGLEQGTYSVKITPPADTKLCGPDDTIPVTLTCNQDGTASFCLCPCLGSAITGSVLCTSGNTTTPQGNITVTAYDAHNAVAGTATTLANGTYSIPNLAPGVYTVTATVPPKYQSCDDLSKVVTLVCEQDGTASFCLCPPPPVVCDTTIKGTVKCTTTGALISGATITVRNSSNVVVATKTTGADGTYLVTGLPVGTYSVKITVPNGYTLCSSSSSCNVTLVCGSIKTVDFCVCAPCVSSVITGTIKCSTNGQAISGVTVKVYDSANVLKGTATTSTAGTYTISGLAAGNYSVRITVPSGYQSCCGSGTTTCVTLTCPQTKTVDFCVCPSCVPPTVTGTIKCSSNGQPVANVTVKIYDSGHVQRGSTTTGSDGKYTIANLATGYYTVKITLPSGYNSCCGSGTSSCIRLTCGETQRVGFCACPACQPASVSGTVKCSTTSQTIPGVVVKLYNSSNVQVGSSVTTGSDGKYSFTGVAAGNYTVKITVPSGYETCCNTGTSSCISVACGQAKCVDFCVCPACQPGSVRGTVKCASSGQLISGATVTVYNSNSQSVGSTTTASNGTYTVGNLAAGNYTVKLSVPSGWAACGTTSTCVNVTCGQAKTVDYCLCPPCQPSSVTGTIKCSSNGQAIAGVVVKVYRGTTQKGSATTGTDGKYSISGLAAGDYTVKITVPSGYQSCGSVSSCITLGCGQSKCVDFCVCPPCGPASVSGTIKCSSNNQGVGGITVQAVGSNGQVAGSAVTASNGTYTISNLIAGGYTIKAVVGSGYQSCGSTSSCITLSCGQCKTGINFCVCSACGPATVTGKITCNTSGKVQSGVTVQVLKGSNVVGSAVTGTDGKYTISGLAAGSYTVRIVPVANKQKACCDTTECISLSCGQCKTVNFCVCPTSGSTCWH